MKNYFHENGGVQGLEKILAKENKIVQFSTTLNNLRENNYSQI